MNILLRLAYNGTAYHGFQVQKNALSVCEVLQDAMQAVLGARPAVKGCSRTDAGVHARGYCVNFWYDTDIPLEKLPLALNAHLPEDVRVFRAQAVPEDFHARYSAQGKRYAYHILNSAVDDPFRTGFYYRMAGMIDAARMQVATKHLVGTHDFAAFQAAGSDVLDTVRTITQCRVQAQGRWLALRVTGDGFLYNMVRIMAGTLLQVGTGALMMDDLPDILASRNRQRAGPTLPAKGLVLERVFYSDDALGIL